MDSELKKNRLSKSYSHIYKEEKMANEFSNNKKTRMIQAVVEDNMDYVKKSKSYLSEEERKSKKYR